MKKFFLLALLLVLFGFRTARAAEDPKLLADIDAKRNISYVENGHERQKLDLFLPKTKPEGKLLPLVVWVHGGAWVGGTKENCPGLPLTKFGFAVASVGYRMSYHAPMPAQIQDCMAAVRWLKDHAAENGIDPDRICAWGASAGGHLVALLGTAPDEPTFNQGAKTSAKVNCVVDFFGPFDFTTIMSQSDPKTTAIMHDAPDSPESKLIGGPVLENRDKALKASPVSYVSKGDAPTMIVHGTNDLLVPYQQSVDFEAALKKAGVEVKLHTVKGGGHGQGFGDAENKAALAFMIEHLKP